MKHHTDRLHRLKQLHAKALGLYMAFRMNGYDGEAQRLDPTSEITMKG